MRVWTRAEARRVAARPHPWLRLLVAAVAAVGMLAIAAHSDVLKPVSHTADPHPAHSAVSSLGGQFVIPVGHSHVDSGSAGVHHEAFPTAMLTKSSFTVLTALGLVAAMVLAASALTGVRVPAGRGPPGRPATALSGQDRLTRFCLSRR